MRRLTAAVLLGMSMWLGSLAWSGFLVNRTVMDPGRSEDVANTIYEDEAVQDALVDAVADALERMIPDGFSVERATLEGVARATITSPAVKALLVDAFVRTHAAFLGEGDPPERIDAGAVGAAARQALVEVRPELDEHLPRAPELAVDLPTERIPDASPVRDFLAAAVPILALVAAAGASASLLLAPNRPAILRRAGIWAMGLSSFVLLFAFGIPALAARFAPDRAEVISAIVGALAAATRVPAVALAVSGAGVFAASFLWRSVPAVARGVGGITGGGDPDLRDRSSVPPLRRRDVPRPYRPPASRPPATGPDPADRPLRRPDPDGYGTRRRPEPDPHPGYPDRPRSTRGAGSPGPDDRWVPGVGYVRDGDGPSDED